MVRIVALIGILILFHSCAVVGGLEGGEKDEFAPKVVRMNPENGSLHFTSKVITIQFDEYVQLNNPNENILVLPADLKVEAKLVKKKLVLKLLNEPSPNTTYQISLNNLVKDISESNDSLMHYVFSTGSFIDSLSYSGQVVDAYSGAAKGKVLIGLYQLSDSVQVTKPRYFSTTDQNGKFVLNYLHEGHYKVVAFQDENKTLTYDVNEQAGFLSEVLDLHESVEDSSNLLLFPGKQLAKVRTKKIIEPSLLQLGASFPLMMDSITIDGEKLLAKNTFSYSQDSLGILLPDNLDEVLEVVVRHDGLVDSLSIRVNKNASGEVKHFTIPEDKNISREKKLTALFSDAITEVNTELIRVTIRDSVKQMYELQHEGNQLILSFPDSINEAVQVRFLPGALRYRSGAVSDSIPWILGIKPPSDFGTIVMKNEVWPENAYLEFLLGGKVVLRKTCASLLDNPIVDLLEPGLYRFRIVIDANQNGHWDTGDLIQNKQAEKVLHFPNEIKIRANWENELELEIKSN